MIPAGVPSGATQAEVHCMLYCTCHSMSQHVTSVDGNQEAVKVFEQVISGRIWQSSTGLQFCPNWHPD